MEAIIVGAGVGGPAAALALRRAGIGAAVFEAHQRTTADVGSYLTLTPNGLDALRTLHALGPVVNAGFPTRKNIIWNDRGARLGTITLGKPLDDGTVAHTVKRARLSLSLQDEALKRGIRIEFGKRLVAAERDRARVVACFEDGKTAAGDLLIGADGIHSPTRKIIDQAAPAPRYLGLVNFGGYTPDAHLPYESEAWHLVFGKRAFFGFIREAGGGAVWFANVPRVEVTAEERRATSHEQWKRQLIDLFSADAGPAADLVHRGELDVAGDNTYDLPRLPKWFAGPMIVIGDAAHAPAPSSGQGASLAMEDAIVLAKALRDRPTVAEAFAAYERLRRQRVERVVAEGARASSSKTPGVVGRLLRDVVLRLVFRFVVTERSLAWMYDHRIDWQEAASVRERLSHAEGASAP